MTTTMDSCMATSTISISFYATRVSTKFLNSKKFYLPHHAVVKVDSTTTPFRVVVNGSAKSSTGVSLNDTLGVGPTLQPQLVVTLIAFQLHVFVFTGDIFETCIGKSIS